MTNRQKPELAFISQLEEQLQQQVDERMLFTVEWTLH